MLRSPYRRPNGEVHGGLALGISRINIGAAIEQQFHNSLPPSECSQHEWRLTVRAGGVDVRTALQEQRNDLFVAVATLNGAGQQRDTAIVFFSHVRAGVK